MTSEAVTTVGHPRMETGFSIYGFRGRSAFNPKEKKCNMGGHGLTHQDGALYSDAEYLDIESTS